MEIFISLCLSFLDFIEGAYKFLSCPLSDVTSMVFSDHGFAGNILGTGIQKAVDLLIDLLPGLANFSLASIFLGGGITFVLLWRLWKFIGDGFGL